MNRACSRPTAASFTAGFGVIAILMAGCAASSDGDAASSMGTAPADTVIKPFDAYLETGCNERANFSLGLVTKSMVRAVYPQSIDRAGA